MVLGYEEFIDRVYYKTRFNLKAYKRPQMERRINTLMRSVGAADYAEYLRVLDQDPSQYRRFIDYLTINVSEFFRNQPHWLILEKTVLPQLAASNNDLRIWSAGCSTGEEPYSLAILLSELAYQNKWHILATDIDHTVLKKAEEGLFSDKALVNLDKKIQAKYFEPSDKDYKVKSFLQQGIKFLRHDLLRDEFQYNFDLILCRNVVIYFTEETKAKLYAKFHRSLKSGGFLFTGSTEQIFQARQLGYHSPVPFFYQKI